VKNILKFKPISPAKLPKIKRKSKSRLRVIRSSSDLRIPPEIFNSYLNRFLDSLEGWTEVYKDDKYAWILTGNSEYHLPTVTYRVTRWTGDIHLVREFVADRLPIGNIYGVGQGSP
jgi:hypothetical protein